MRFFTLFILFVLAGIHSFGAYAVMFKWVDEQGNTHYTTTPPPESAQHDRAVLDEQGMVVDTIEGARTPEEKAKAQQRAAEAEKRKKAENAARKRDRVLQVSYSSVADIEKKRDARLRYLDSQIKALESKLTTANDEFNGLLATAIQEERTGKYPSEELKGNIRSAKREFIDFESQLIKARQNHLETTQDFAEDVKRFKELMGIE